MIYRNVLWLLFLLLTAANVYIFFNRRGYEYVKQSSYAELYPDISKGIASISIEKSNEAVINLKGYPAPGWSVLCNDTVIASGLSLPVHFTLKEKLNRYTLCANDTLIKPIIIDIDYSPAHVYQAYGSSTGANFEIRYCSESFTANDSADLLKWRDPLDYTDKNEITLVQKIITDSLNIKAGDSTEKKIKLIGSYIYKNINKSMGVPADTVAAFSPYRQFCLAKEGKAKIWCGNITDIFHLFAGEAGIICRKIGLTGKQQEFYVGNHTLNECYITETGEWACVDITQNILLLKDTAGKFINTVDLYHHKKIRETNSLVQYSATGSAITSSIYNNPEKKYLWRENDILFALPYHIKTLYSFGNKFKRYAGVHPWLEVYSEKKHYNNSRFYLKTFLFHTWLLLGLLILVLHLINKKRKA